MDKYSDKFKALVSRWPDAYTCAVQSYVAVNTPGGFRLLYGRTVFELTRSAINEMPFKFATANIMAGRFVRAVGPEDVSVAIANAEAGEMWGVDEALTLPPQSNNQSEKVSFHLPYDVQPSNSSLVGWGDTRHNLFYQNNDGGLLPLECELKASEIPFESLNELVEQCGLSFSAQGSDRTTLELIATSPGAIEAASTIIDGKALIQCRVAKALTVANLRVGHNIVGKNVRGSIMGDKLQWREEKGVFIGSHMVAVGEAPMLRGYLSYDGTLLHRWLISDPAKRLNPRCATHETIDPTLDVLRAMLLTPGRDSTSFEGAVSTLLTLLGFSAGYYGSLPRFQDGPDIIAFTPSGRVAVVECTIGLPNLKDKLSKLVQRTRLIEGKLTDAGYGSLQVQPVIVTPLSRDELAVGLNDARQHRVAVMCKSNLEDALSQIALPPETDQFFQQLKRSIPAPGLQSMLGTLE